jgi:hypothetical protein
MNYITSNFVSKLDLNHYGFIYFYFFKSCSWYSFAINFVF